MTIKIKSTLIISRFALLSSYETYRSFDINFLLHFNQDHNFHNASVSKHVIGVLNCEELKKKKVGYGNTPVHV